MDSKPHSEFDIVRDALNLLQIAAYGAEVHPKNQAIRALLRIEEQLEACREEGIRLAMDETASSMAAQGKRVWEPAQSDAAKRIVQLENAIRHELGVTHGDATIRRLRAALEPNPASRPPPWECLEPNLPHEYSTSVPACDEHQAYGCPECFPATEPHECPYCDGRGWNTIAVHDPADPDGEPLPEQEQCATCGGSGEVSAPASRQDES